jgi:uncharacterized protein
MIPRRAGARRFALAPLALALVVFAAPLPGRLAVAAADPDPAAEGPAIPPAAGYVNDRAGVMDEPARAKLEAFLDQLQKKTGVQFAVLTVDSTAPLTPSEYKVQVFQRWGIGKRGEDNGLLMLVAVQEHQVRFETGYGLEGTLPDGFQSRVFREVMRPRMVAGDFAGGITAGVLACAARIADQQGVKLEWDGRELRYDRPSASGRFPPALAILLVVVLFAFARAFAPRRSRRRGWWIGPGLGGGLGGGWGGGFGGGGGGGASFGGFGGGASGGGGGGGSW